MKRRCLALPLALLLLSGCQAPAEVSSPPPSAAPSVAVHWDALDEREPPVANRRYEGYTDDLIPAEDYGQLIPYIGGENSLEAWGTGWFYGLATREGEIVTDPVFLGVNRLTYYDYDTRATAGAPVLVLHKGGIDGEADPEDYGRFYHRYGLAAADGAWYTGMNYSALICQSELGALMFETGGDVVMIGLDGEELWRWAADSIPLSGLAPQEYFWESVNTAGPYLSYVTEWNERGEPSYLYVDLRSGQVLPGVPDDLPTYPEYADGVGYYSCGWYEQADGVITIHPDDGPVHSFEMPAGCDYPDIDGDRVIFRPNTDREGQARSIVTDLSGNELFRSDYYLNYIWQSWGDTPSLLYYSEFQDDGSGASWSLSTVLDRDGRELFSAREYPEQFGDRLIFADETSYRVTDLAGRDLIRLSRWAALDLPADD